MSTNNDYNEKKDNNKCYDDYNPANDYNDYDNMNGISSGSGSSSADDDGAVTTTVGLSAVDELLSKELFQNLCFQKEEDFDDEINGKRCHYDAINETSELISTSLLQLSYELDVVIPNHEKRAYISCQELDERANGYSIAGDTSSSTGVGIIISSYINNIDFRLRFLRCELFDIKKAAMRIVRFLNLGFDLYGESILLRPPLFKDFSSTEKAVFRKGFYQLLPFRSEGIGRRILFINPNTEWDTIDPKIRDKILFYIIYRVGLRNTSIQKEGIIIVSWMDSAFKISNHSINLLSVRISAIHICTTDIPYHGIPRSVVGMMIAQNRSRIKLHAGNADDLKSILKGYLGFVSEHLPITDTGNIKQNYFRKSYKMLHLLEQGGPAAETCKWIECPSLTDVLFQQGRSLSHTPGNSKLLELITSLITGESKNKRSSILQIISKIKLNNGVFLTHNEKGWWDEIDDFEAYKRIDYIFINQGRPARRKNARHNFIS